MKIQLQVKLQVSCPICDRDVLDKDERLTEVALFGLTDDPYRVCPCCLHEVSDDEHGDPDFRRRLRVWLYRQRGRVIREPEGVHV